MTARLANAAAVNICEDMAALSVAVAQRIQQLASEAIAERDAFHLVLTGGNTPKSCYQQLCRLALDWRQVYIYYGDERCVPVGDAQRNDLMAQCSLLQHVPVPAEQVFSMPAELGAEAGAAAYAETIRGRQFDLVLLGMGEDGHIASLFPGQAQLASEQPTVAVLNSPKPPPERVSLGLSVINEARNKLFLLAGEGKRQALGQLLQGVDLPAARVAEAEWYMDSCAWPGEQ